MGLATETARNRLESRIALIFNIFFYHTQPKDTKRMKDDIGSLKENFPLMIREKIF